MVRRGEKLSLSVAREIVDSIMSSGLRPGESLAAEAEMAASFGVSRQSLREALRLLEFLGIITIKTGPHGGPIIMAVDAKAFGELTAFYYQLRGTTFRDVVAARLALEPLTARLAAERSTEISPPELDGLLCPSDWSIVRDDSLFRRQGQDFHQRVATLSGNNVIELLVHSCTEVFHGRVSTVIYRPSQRPAVTDIHNKIARAIQAGDAAVAETLMREHMTDYSSTLLRKFANVMAERVQW